MTPVRRVLIVRLGALGDIVHAIPVAVALRRAWPAAEIDWLVSARHREILELVPVLDRLLAVNDRGGARGGRSLADAVREMRARRYDLAIDLQGLIKSAALARLSGARRVLGFARAHLREPVARLFYTERYDPGAGREAGEPPHVVRMNLDALRAVGIEAGPPEFPLSVPPSAVADGLKSEAGGRYALLNPGAAWPNKRWPASRFAALARMLRDRMMLRSVVIWGPGEREIGEAIVAESEGAALLSPQTTIADVIAIARGADVMVSGDTGPTHLAAAVATPIVGIYGPTSPGRNGPWSPDDVTVSRSEICECPHLRRCVGAHWCLLDLPVEEVLEGVERRLTVARRT
jgi:lipopolysaccharide heptosyltransferase I